MAFIHGKSGSILLGPFNLSGYSRQFSTVQEQDLHDVSVYGDSSRDYILGLKRGSVTISGLFEPTDNLQDEQLVAALSASTARALSVSPQATTLGNVAYTASSRIQTYNHETPFDDLITWSADAETDSDTILVGHWLHALTAETAGVTTSSVDNGAASTAGGRANLHVTAWSGTSATVKIQDSADNSSWADLLTFSTVSATTSESVSISGTVRRYARVVLSGTITSITFAVALGRRN